MRIHILTKLSTALGFVLMAMVFSTGVAQASIIHSYVCADWSLSGSAGCSSNILSFTTSCSAANNGSGNTIYDISNGGAGQTVYVTATLSSYATPIRYGCYGSVTNCSFTAFANAGANNEVAMSVPAESGGGNFAYLVIDNNSGAGSGDVATICVDNDGTSCTAGGGGGGGAPPGQSFVLDTIPVFSVLSNEAGPLQFNQPVSNVDFSRVGTAKQLTIYASFHVSSTFTDAPLTGAIILSSGECDFTMGTTTTYTPGDYSGYVDMIGSCDLSLVDQNSYIAVARHVSNVDVLNVGGSATQYQTYPFVHGGSPDRQINGIFNMGFRLLSDVDSTTGTLTRIIDTFPANNATVATSTAFQYSAYYYVSPLDMNPPLFLRLHLFNSQFQESQQVGPIFALGAGGKTSVDFTDDYPVSASGYAQATSTYPVLQVGDYVLEASIIQKGTSILGFEFGGKVYTTDTISFTVSTSTGYDNLAAEIKSQAVALGSLTAPSGSCNPLNFNASQCVALLFNPPASGQTMADEVGQVLAKPPWGYATRAVQLLSGQASSTSCNLDIATGQTLCAAVSSDLPTLNINLNDTHLASVKNVNNLNLTPWGELMTGTSILATATSTKDGETFEQIVEPGWNFLVVFIFGFGMVVQLLGVPYGSGIEKQGRYEDYRQRRAARRILKRR